MIAGGKKNKKVVEYTGAKREAKKTSVRNNGGRITAKSRKTLFHAMLKNSKERIQKEREKSKRVQ